MVRMGRDCFLRQIRTSEAFGNAQNPTSKRLRVYLQGCPVFEEPVITFLLRRFYLSFIAIQAVRTGYCTTSMQSYINLALRSRAT